jgi:hypothetical protein
VPHPATESLFGHYPICEGHKIVHEIGEEEDALQASLDHLERWIRTADLYNVNPLRKALRTLRDGFTAELARLEVKQLEISERYSLPPRGLEQLEAQKRTSPLPEGPHHHRAPQRCLYRILAALA